MGFGDYWWELTPKWVVFRWVLWAGCAGVGSYLMLTVAYIFGVITDVVEYLYLGYLAQTFFAVSALTASLHALSQLAKIRTNYVPVTIVLTVAIPAVFMAAIAGGTGSAHGLLSYQLLVVGFAFYVFISYLYCALGRFSQNLKLITASLFYVVGIIFAGVAALYLYVTGMYLIGAFSSSAYSSP